MVVSWYGSLAPTYLSKREKHERWWRRQIITRDKLLLIRFLIGFSVTRLGDYSSEIIFGPLLLTFGDFFLVTLIGCSHVSKSNVFDVL